MTVIVQVEYFDRCTSRSCVPNNADTFRIPGKVLSPDISAWVEERYDCTGLWIAAFSTITAPLVAVAASESQVLAIIRSAGSLGQDMIDREADELPSFIRMVVFAVKIGPFSNDAPGGRGDRHYNLNDFVLCERDDLASSTQCLGHRSLYIPDLLGEIMCRFFLFKECFELFLKLRARPKDEGCALLLDRDSSVRKVLDPFVRLWACMLIHWGACSGIGLWTIQEELAGLKRNGTHKTSKH
jgi:hypothetical protein